MTSPLHPLAAYATPATGGRGRAVSEAEDPMRSPFQRDRGRILFCNAFLRMQGKTQVFPAGESDHYRTRLTHTMAVASISRDLARHLGLNEDLSECIALAHDLGHPPFGHAGEAALNEWMKEHGEHFEHNEQSHRIVTLLERHSAPIPGLNLSLEVVDGLLKHTKLDHTPEAMLVNICDQIAYTAHDCDDGLRSGMLAIEEISQLKLGARAQELRQERGTYIRNAIAKILMEDLVANVRLVDDKVRFAFSDDVTAGLNELSDFLYERMYFHPELMRLTVEGQRVVRVLCERYLAEPIDAVRTLQERTDSSLVEAVKDYVAGMTDQFARINAA